MGVGLGIGVGFGMGVGLRIGVGLGIGGRPWDVVGLWDRGRPWDGGRNEGWSWRNFYLKKDPYCLVRFLPNKTCIQQVNRCSCQV